MCVCWHRQTYSNMADPRFIRSAICVCISSHTQQTSHTTGMLFPRIANLTDQRVAVFVAERILTFVDNTRLCGHLECVVLNDCDNLPSHTAEIICHIQQSMLQHCLIWTFSTWHSSMTNNMIPGKGQVFNNSLKIVQAIFMTKRPSLIFLLYKTC